MRDDTPLPEEKAYDKVKFHCNVTEKEYADIVEKTREYIYDGDIFQAVLSRQFVSDYEGVSSIPTGCSALPILRLIWCI